MLALMIAGLVALNAWASSALIRDNAVSGRQRTIQLVLVWLLPIVGALATISIRKTQARNAAPSVLAESSVPDQSIDLHQSANDHTVLGGHISHDP